jgi:hypothetical protein
VRTRLTAAALIAGTVLVAPAAARAAGTPACDTVVTANLVLSADLSCEGTALRLAGSNITVDLGSHTVRGSGNGAGVVVTGHNVTLTNGTVRGFATAVVVGAGVRNTVVRQNRFVNNGTVVQVHPTATGTRLFDNATEMGGDGLG